MIRTWHVTLWEKYIPELFEHAKGEHFESQAQKERPLTRNIEEVMWDVIAWMPVAENRNQW
jgi:hypothetical protein